MHAYPSNCSVKRAQRRTHTRSRLGCLECRRRHKRCDEARPRCGQCSKRGVLAQCRYDVVKRAGVASLADPDHKAAFQESITGSIGLSSEDSTPARSFLVGLSPISPDWRNSERQVILGVGQFITTTISRDTHNWCNFPTVSLNLFSDWIELAFAYDCVRHAMVAHFANLFYPARDAVDLARCAKFHAQRATVALNYELSRFSDKNAQAVEAASECLQRYYGLGFEAKEWMTFVRGTATIRRHMRSKNTAMEKLPQASVGRGQRACGPAEVRVTWIPGKELPRSPADLYNITEALLETLQLMKLFAIERKDWQYSIEHARKLIQRLRTLPVPSTDAQRLWIWQAISTSVTAMPAEYTVLLRPQALDLVIACVFESIPLLFPHLFFPDSYLTFEIEDKRRVIFTVYQYFEETAGRGMSPDDAPLTDSNTCLQLLKVLHYIATTAPIVTQDDDYTHDYRDLVGQKEYEFTDNANAVDYLEVFRNRLNNSASQSGDQELKGAYVHFLIKPEDPFPLTPT